MLKCMNNFSPKKTKIVATIGPASRDAEVLSEMIHAGLNVVRMNFSHGSHEDHLDTIVQIKKAQKRAKKPVAILQDLSGPKIRIGKVQDGVILKKGQSYILSVSRCVGDEKRVFVNFKPLISSVSKGSVIKINDGKLCLEVTKVVGKDIHTTVLVGGPLTSNKGVNVPDVQLPISSLTAKDKEDVLFGIEHKVDFIALSFVQTAKDIQDLRKVLVKNKCVAKIIAKIETTAAVEHLDEILAAADGAMVARGDMAVEVGVERVPLIQKRIIQKCNQLGKPVITATQMLDSMEKNPVPTRAEVSDIANAIIDGTDAIMLSSESAIGAYPVESVQTMTAIALRTEVYAKNARLDYIDQSLDIVDTMTVSAVRIANNVRARLIVTLTESGFTAQMIARFKPHHRIVAITPRETTFNQLQLVYGCTPILSNIKGGIKELTSGIQKIVKKNELAKPGEKIVVTMGSAFGEPGSTNVIFVITV